MSIRRDSHSFSLYRIKLLGHSDEYLLLCFMQERNYNHFNHSLIWSSLLPEINAKMRWEILNLCTLMSVCLFVFSEWENWERPGNMRASRRAPSQCDITLQTLPFSFSVSTRDVLQEEKNSKNTATLTTTVWLILRLLNNCVFFISLYSFYVSFMKKRGNCCWSKQTQRT